MRRPAPIGALSAALLSLALGSLVGCNEDMGEFVQNIPPGVELTATPPEGGTTGYDVEFHWTGWDSDGEVEYFIYAIDPPDIYSTGDSVWTRTDGYSGQFVFQASDFDTLYDWKDNQIAKGWHVFVIKAVDDLGAVSEPDYLAFNAATIAPRSTFFTPPPFGGVQQYQGGPQAVGLRVTFRWEGTDIDGIFTEVPVGYYFKAIDVSGESNWRNLAGKVWEDTTEWIERGPGDTRVPLEFDDGHAYAVSVRAIDEAGAVEPLLLLNSNMLWVGARERQSFPELTVQSTALGRRTWQGWTQDSESYEVPLGSIYEFTLRADANWYGGLIAGFSYGWDLEELDTDETDPEGKGAWTPWSVSRNVITAEFTEARDHFLYIRCKDDGGGMTLATIHFNVVTLDPTKQLGYIDDWRKYPKTSATGELLDDAVWQAMLEGYNYGEDWSEITWDEWEAPLSEQMPTLEFLSQFRVLVWSINDNRALGGEQKSAWYQMNYLSTMHVLAVYMGSVDDGGEKGKVWAFGRGLVESAVLPYGGYGCEYPYIVDEHSVLGTCGIRRGSFAFEFLHLVGDFHRHDPTSGGARISLFDRASDRQTHVFVDTAGPAVPQYTRLPAAELYPNLPPMIPLHPDGSTRSKAFYIYEVLEYPEPSQEFQDLFYDREREEMTGLIPLYRHHARDLKSPSHDKYCGFRFIPTKSSDPGEIVFFFFPMFPFNDPEIRATAKVVLSDWFGLHDPDAVSADVRPAGR